MTDDHAKDGTSDPDVRDALQHLDRLTDKLLHEAAALNPARTRLSSFDLFLMGALQRTLAQAAGFRLLVEARNFSCAAAILRMQIDTAMRVFGLSLVRDPNECCRLILEGTQLNRLKSRSGDKLSDAYLSKELGRSFPWVVEVYREASDFVHLSGRHFHNAVATTDDQTRMVTLAIGAEDPDRADSFYIDIVRSFFEATKLAGRLILTPWRRAGNVRKGPH